MQALEDEPENSPEARRRRSPLLRFARSKGRLTGMPVLALLYPSTTLAEIADPLIVGDGRAGRGCACRTSRQSCATYLALLPR